MEGNTDKVPGSSGQGRHRSHSLKPAEDWTKGEQDNRKYEHHVGRVWQPFHCYNREEGRERPGYHRGSGQRSRGSQQHQESERSQRNAK